ncbi:MAG: leucine-rich repeat domain-containing protein [Prevotella sp.]|nr:leucine-rich repeat domain-containing protein [Prevotella sp.]
MKKRFLKLDASLAKSLAALLLCSAAGMLSSCADDDGLDAGDPNYFTTSRGQFTATIDDGNGNETTLFLIPGTAAGTAVVTFDGSNPLHWISPNTATIWADTYQGDITLPETVTGSDGKTYTLTQIGNEAFMGCRAFGSFPSLGLTAITVPETVESLGEGAFAYTALRTVSLPEGLTEIPVGCFGYSQYLDNVVLPSTVRTIGRLAFCNCYISESIDGVSVKSGLSNITLNEGLEEIGSNAFYGCQNLKEITLPSTVTTIGSMAFNTTALTTFNFTPAITSIGEKAFGNNASMSEITIPGTVKTISEGMFTACRGLTTITLEEGIETIGEQAFYDCRNPKLISIRIPASVTRIGDKAFGGRGAEVSLNSRGEKTTTLWYSWIADYYMDGEVPPTLDGVLYETNQDATAGDTLTPLIHVKPGCKAAYETAPGWSSLTIVEDNY